MSSPDGLKFQIPPPVRVGWIGTGVMGVPMCEHLIRAGYALTVHSRTRAKAESLLRQGALWAESPQKLAEQTDVVCTMVGFPHDVHAVYLQADGLLSHCHERQVFVDFTTSEPILAAKLAALAQTKGAFALDAPVSGGEVGARNATLSIMIGGEAEVMKALQPILSSLGKILIYHGTAGKGQHAKLCNQITIAGTMVGVCEGLLYARQAGLDGEALLQSIQKGAAGCWTLNYLAPRILKEDFASGFFVEHFIKDLEIALEEANRMGLILPGLSLVRKLYLALQSRGYGRSGTQALLLALEELAPALPKNFAIADKN